MNTTTKPAFTAKHITGINEFTEALDKIELVKKNHIVAPQAERLSEFGDEHPVTHLPAIDYKLQSVLFNGSISIKNGTVSIKDSGRDRWDKLERLFKFLERFENRNIENFIEVFEYAMIAYIEQNPANGVCESFGTLHELQQLVRIIISLRDEPGKIVADLQKIEHSFQFGIVNA